MMTAFYLKEKFCRSDEFEAIKTYFVINFPQFLGKYTTEWLLLGEPDVSQITPRVLNHKLIELKDTYEKLVAVETVPNQEDDWKVMDDPQNPRDFNKLVEDLGEESAKVDLLRKLHLEREEKQLRSKKRMRQAMLER